MRDLYYIQVKTQLNHKNTYYNIYFKKKLPHKNSVYIWGYLSRSLENEEEKNCNFGRGRRGRSLFHCCWCIEILSDIIREDLVDSGKETLCLNCTLRLIRIWQTIYLFSIGRLTRVLHAVYIWSQSQICCTNWKINCKSAFRDWLFLQLTLMLSQTLHLTF